MIKTDVALGTYEDFGTSLPGPTGTPFPWMRTPTPSYVPTSTRLIHLTVTSTPPPPTPTMGAIAPLYFAAASPSPVASAPPADPPPTYQYYAFNYSYYWPPFGPPNCAAVSWSAAGCADTTASGQPWSKWVGTGVAVPIQMRAEIPLMTVIDVLAPPILAGRYTVIDFCGGCEPADGRIQIDFLSGHAMLNWNVAVLVRVP